MFWLFGSDAFSPFKMDKLRHRLCAAGTGVIPLAAQQVYFVSNRQPLGEAELDKLAALLGCDDQSQPVGELLLVVPRIGTLTPWSSKSTDIAQVCGLENVNRLERGTAFYFENLSRCPDLAKVHAAISDRMTQIVFSSLQQAQALFDEHDPTPAQHFPLARDGESAIERANQDLGLALSAGEIGYLARSFTALGRDPTDAELMMFAQANSEHCRHKIFNATWRIDGVDKSSTLFDMVRHSHKLNPGNTLSAYHDNAAVMAGWESRRLFPDRHGTYTSHAEKSHVQIKVETHNHPTAISPYAGAATGSGGEIRDEAATGIGAKTKAGLCGFSVSNLKLPTLKEHWENDYGKPERISSALQIMLDGPIGAAAFNNEFGRPALAGYFRTFEAMVDFPGRRELRGYHKPIMVAGGYGNVRDGHVDKRPLQEGDLLVVLGGPAMLIGLGGGAASSMTSGSSAEDLDFASVQRDNPEMQRRCQEVIDRCCFRGSDNPIVSIHDVGAGGISNAIPEILHDSNMGGLLELRDVPNAEPGMSPMQIWSNEAQERYVLAIRPNSLADLTALCERERCPFAVVGTATEALQLTLHDDLFDDNAVDMSMDVLFGKPPRMHRDVTSISGRPQPLNLDEVVLEQACHAVLRHPCVADKSFLITIGDRSISGLVARDQMVGPWQVPVSDVAVTLDDFEGYYGQAMAMGERPPLALIDAPAAGRMAVAESITNIAAADIADIGDIKLSANWMCAAGYPGDDARLFATVKAVAEEVCPALGICIPVGKDSMSMQTVWRQDGEDQHMAAPLSLVVTAFSRVVDVRKTLTPELDTQVDSIIVLVDLSLGKNRLGGSILAQTEAQMGNRCPDLDDPKLLKAFFQFIQAARQQNLLLAYHDRSDGGLWASLCEMSFASGTGLALETDAQGDALLGWLFAEECGALLQVSVDLWPILRELADSFGLGSALSRVATLQPKNITIDAAGERVFCASYIDLRRSWSRVSMEMSSLRDNPECAQAAYDSLRKPENRLQALHSFDLKTLSRPLQSTATRPRIAILRDQGVNGQTEMAAAFDAAGFDSVDVHMTDLISGRLRLDQYQGLAACGGFSYGDVLGAGRGWASTILYHDEIKQQFADFFANTEKFALGVCNGCQMLSALKSIIPGAKQWPSFLRNRSEQFEARLVQVEIQPGPSLFFAGMAGTRIPVTVAHGEGRVEFTGARTGSGSSIALRYVDAQGQATDEYPANPNGSEQGITGLCNDDGRITIMMPHPERVFRSVQLSWHPQDWPEYSPWMKMFRNARDWLK